MNKSIIESVGNPEGKIQSLISALRSIGAPVDGWVIDHLGLRSGPIKSDYPKLCAALESEGHLVGPSMVADREVKLITPDEPIEVDGFVIFDIEVLSHKESSSYDRGWEHIEIISDRDLQSLSEYLQNIESDVVFTVDDKNIDREHNPDIRVRFKDLPGLSVKYHLTPLRDIVQQEIADKRNQV